MCFGGSVLPEQEMKWVEGFMLYEKDLSEKSARSRRLLKYATVSSCLVQQFSSVWKHKLLYRKLKSELFSELVVRE